MAIAEAIKEALWMRRILCELGVAQGVTSVFCDSQSVIHLTKNLIYHERTNHIDVRYHFVREIISQNQVEVKKVRTTDNPADMLTKLVPVATFKDCLGLVGICS